MARHHGLELSRHALLGVAGCSGGRRGGSRRGPPRYAHTRSNSDSNCAFSCGGATPLRCGGMALLSQTAAPHLESQRRRIHHVRWIACCATGFGPAPARASPELSCFLGCCHFHDSGRNVLHQNWMPVKRLLRRPSIPKLAGCVSAESQRDLGETHPYPGLGGLMGGRSSRLRCQNSRLSPVSGRFVSFRGSWICCWPAGNGILLASASDELLRLALPTSSHSSLFLVSLSVLTISGK